jgi:putative RecB family exonuclease
MQVMTTTAPKAPAKRARKPKWPLAWDGDRLVTTTAEATARVDRSRLSASTAKAVLSCPARMVADRLMRGPEDPLDPAPIGTAAHTVLERLFGLPSAQRTAAAADELLDGLMLELASPDTPQRWPGIERGSIGRWRAEVGEKVGGIFELEDPRQVLVRRTEWPLDAVEVAGVPFTGFIDRADIARDGERFGCRIVDYKSGKYKGVAPFGDDHGDQLRLYAAAVQVADGRLPIAADLLYIGARRARSVSLSRREMSATLEGFTRAWVDLKRHVAAQAFPATPTPLCGWCPLVNGCPAAARDGRVARVEGLPTEAELGIPVLRPLGMASIGSAVFGPDGEPAVIPAADLARDDPSNIDPADTREPPADLDPDVPETAEPCAAHIDPQEPGMPGSDTNVTTDSTANGGAAMTTSLLREDKPWEQTAGPDGLLNPNSYSATAVFGIVEMAVELLHKAGVQLGPGVVTALSRTLAHVVLAVQRDLAGSTSYQDGVNTRLRGALRTAVATMPPPFGGDTQAWSSWVARVIRRTESIAKAAVALFDDDPAGEPPYADLVDLARPAPVIGTQTTPDPAARLKAVS